MGGAGILKLILTPTLPDGCKHYPGGILVQLIKTWRLFKSKAFWFTLLAKSFDTLPTSRWFLMV